MADDGWLGVTVPAEYGGQGRGMVDAVLGIPEISASGAGMNGSISVHIPMMALEPFVLYGPEDLKRDVIPRLLDGSITCALAITEPEAGSDTSRTQVRATRTEGGWSISGKKLWITQGLEADHAILVARTSDDGEGRFGGISLFLIDLQDDENIQKRAIPKLGADAISSCELDFDELFVDESRLIGEEGKGFQHLLGAVNPARFSIAGEAVGHRSRGA